MRYTILPTDKLQTVRVTNLRKVLVGGYSHRDYGKVRITAELRNKWDMCLKAYDTGVIVSEYFYKQLVKEFHRTGVLVLPTVVLYKGNSYFERMTRSYTVTEIAAREDLNA